MPHPPRPPAGPLATRWDQPVHSLVEVTTPTFTAVQAERHRLFSYAVMGIVATQWNGNLYGQYGDYGIHRRGQRNPPGDPGGRYQGGTYLGHNIAAIAVDDVGEIIDFDLNHNSVFHRSTEHAEARLIRRVFGLTQIFDAWAAGPRRVSDRVDVLNQTTIYTSLESCSQCSGIMALGSIRDVVFLQRDPNQNSIGNILYNLQQPRYPAPRPIPADSFQLEAFDQLDTALADFSRAVADTTRDPFFRGLDGRDEHRSPAITAFLCTDAAQRIFATWKAKLAEPVLPDNKKIRQHCIAFVDYVQRRGMRGTCH